MKIQPIETVAKIVHDLKQQGKKVALCHGCFDLVHPGHIKHLQAAKALGDVLVVTVTPDCYVDKGEGRPVFPQTLRAESIAALEAVDYVAVNAWPTAEDTLRLLRPDFYVKGQEFETLEDKTGKIQREYNVAEEVGAEVRFTHEPVFSSTKLLKQHPFRAVAAESGPRPARSLAGAYPESTCRHLAALAGRYGYDDVAERLEALRNLKVLLIGDGIIDEYHFCASMGRSAKSPLVVYRHETHEEYAGGALAIANHISGICGQVHLVTLLGNHDSREDFIRAKLGSNVEPRFFYRDDGPTVIKARYLDQYMGQKMFELNYLNNHYINKEIEAEVVAHLDRVGPDYDVVLVSDFGHGFITAPIIEAVKRHAKVLAVNSQTNAANAGFNLITKYRSPHFVCLDEPEARLATQDRFGPVDALVQNVTRTIGADCVIVTLGKGGSIGFNARGEVERCPIFSTRVVDTVGAGDAFFAYSSLCYAAGTPLDLTTFIGNVVGAVGCLIVGNKRPVYKAEILEFIRDLLALGAHGLETHSG